jgi:hypothetical protein
VDTQKHHHQATIDPALGLLATVVVAAAGRTILDPRHPHHIRRPRHLADTRARHPVQVEAMVVAGAADQPVAVGINR